MPKQHNYKQKFRREWLQHEALKDWILEVPDDISAVRCRYCKCSLKCKLCDLVDHSKTKKHQIAAEPFSSKRQSKLNFPKVRPNTDTATAEAGIALFTSCHCAISCADHLADMSKRCFKMNEVKMHRTKCSAVIKNILLPHFQNDLRRGIGDGYYSILIDESTDIRVIKQLGLCIIYFSKTQESVISTFLGLYELESGDATSIVKAVKTALTDFGLDIQKMRGIGTDNASVMVGINNGVYKKLKDDVNHLVLIRCVCHSIQLAVSNACSEALPRNLEFMLAETYNWFVRSSGRQLAYKNMYKILNDGTDPLKIVQASQTRWLSVEVAVNRVLGQWRELKNHFEEVKNTEKCYTAEMLYQMYNDVSNELYFIFLKPVLAETQIVNKAFQSNKIDPTKLLRDLTLQIKSIGKKIAIPTCRIDFLKENVQNYLDPKPYLGYEFEKKLDELKASKAITTENEKIIRDRCRNFLINLVTQLQLRLPTNIEILESVSLLSPDNCLRVIKESIIPLAELMKFPSEVITKIDFQWKNFTSVKWLKTSNTIEFWNEVMHYKDASEENPFVELSNLAYCLLVLPWSNAEIERAFSQLNLVKSDLRNKLQCHMLNAILTIRAGLRRIGKCCHDYELPDHVLKDIGTMAAYVPTGHEEADDTNLFL